MDLGPRREILWFPANEEEEAAYKQRFRALAPDASALALLVLTVLQEAEGRDAVASSKHRALKDRAQQVMRVLVQTGDFGDDPCFKGRVPSADVSEWGEDGTPGLLKTMQEMAEAGASYCAQLNATQLRMIKTNPAMKYIAGVRGTALFPGIWSWRLKCDLSDVFSQASDATRRSVRLWLMRHFGSSPVWIARADDPAEADMNASDFVMQVETDAYAGTPRETDGPFTIIMSDYIRQINERIVRIARMLEDKLFAELVGGPIPLTHALFGCPIRFN